MSIRRGFVPSVDRFTTVPNDWLRDERLSFKARGLLAYLLSHREGWEISGVRELARKGLEGREAITGALQELEELGYLKRERQRTAGNRLAGTDFLVTEPLAGKPTGERGQRLAAVGSPVPGIPGTGKPGTGNPTTKKNNPPKTNDQKTRKSSSPEAAAPRSDVDQMCALLADLVEENGSRRPSVTKAWRDAARLMIDKDGRDADKAMALIRWCQQDGFWRKNVMSMVKFRDQYDRLRLEATDAWMKQRQASAPRPTAMERAEAIAGAGWELQAEIDAQRASLVAAAAARVAVSA